MGIPLSSRIRQGFLSCLFILILCLSQVSCTSKTQSPETAAEIRIGVIHTTGVKDVEAISKNVLDMVRGRLGEYGGLVVGDKRYPVTFVIRDVDGHIPEQAVQAAKELANRENVLANVGLLSSIDAIPAGEVAEQSGIPLIASASTHPQVTAGRRFVFRIAFLDDFQAQAMARFSMLDLGAKNIAVLYNAANVYSRGLADTFNKTVVQRGGRIVAFESYVTGETDFITQLEKIRGISPDVLYLPNYFNETAAIVVIAKSMEIDAILLGADCWEVETASNMPQFEGAYMMDHLTTEVLTDKSREFVDKYRLLYGQTPSSGAFLTYDAYGILLTAIQHAGGLDPVAIRDALYDIGPYEGVSGKIDFKNSGDPEMEAVIVRFEKGRTRFIKKILNEHEDQPKSQGEM